MSNYEIRIIKLPVKWRGGKHDSRQASNEKLEQECNGEQQRELHAEPTPIHCANPVENLDASRDSYNEGGGGKESVANGAHPHSEHMMRPDSKADECDHYTCHHHNRISENGLTRKYRDYFRDNGKRR